jgi:hypothetical protein
MARANVLYSTSGLLALGHERVTKQVTKQVSTLAFKPLGYA